MKYGVVAAAAVVLAFPAAGSAGNAPPRKPLPPPRVEAPADAVGTWWPDGMVCTVSGTASAIVCAYRPSGKRIAE
jgi:hypothetical protein